MKFAPASYEAHSAAIKAIQARFKDDGVSLRNSGHTPDDSLSMGFDTFDSDEGTVRVLAGEVLEFIRNKMPEMNATATTVDPDADGGDYEALWLYDESSPAYQDAYNAIYKSV